LVAGVTIVAGSVFAQAPGKPEPTPAAPLNSAPGEGGPQRPAGGLLPSPAILGV